MRLETRAKLIASGMYQEHGSKARQVILERIAVLQSALLKVPDYDPSIDMDWQDLADAGHKIHAIKLVRRSRGLDLREAKGLVESYLWGA